MYEEHFGLRPRPFGESGGPPGSIPLAGREAARRRLRYGLEHGQGPALLFGPPGTGKTLLARDVARDLGGPWAHVAFPAMPAADLLAYIADEFRMPPARGAGLSGAVLRLRDGLAAAAARGERPFLIVDEAHLIDDPATFETLRLVLNFASAGPSDLSLLLVGGPEVLLRLPPSLADRLAARCLLGPLTVPETEAYLSGRLEAAGATAPLFDGDAVAELHRASDGLPRRLNRLADLALLIAYAEGTPRPSASAVLAASREAPFDAQAA